MRNLTLLLLFVLAGCGSIEGAVVRIDSGLDSAKDKAVAIILEEHRTMHEKMILYIEWAEREQVESTERLERLRQGFDND